MIIGSTWPADGEIKQGCQALRVRHPISQLPLDGNGLEIRGGFLEHEWYIRAGQRNRDNCGSGRPIEKGQPGTLVSDFAVLVMQDVGRRWNFNEAQHRSPPGIVLLGH